jgi:hypothetical protein
MEGKMWLFVCSFQLATFRISQRTVFAVLNVVWQAQTNMYFQSVSLAVFLSPRFGVDLNQLRRAVLYHLHLIAPRVLASS